MFVAADILRADILDHGSFDFLVEVDRDPLSSFRSRLVSRMSHS